jgi:hypothetical protein
MSKPQTVGLVVLACGAVVGLITGGPFGLLLAAVCLVVGLVQFVTNEAKGILGKRPDLATGSQPSTSQILVLVKEVHARPLLNGRFQAIRDPDQTDLEFEAFANCWMINGIDDPLQLMGLRIWLRRGDGTDLSLEQVDGDLEGWRFGRLRDDVDSWGLRYIQANQEPMQELSLKEPLQGGVAREGWIHFRVRNVSPHELTRAAITVSVKDSRGRVHMGAAKGPHQVPGRVWPIQAGAPDRRGKEGPSAEAS